MIAVYEQSDPLCDAAIPMMLRRCRLSYYQSRAVLSGALCALLLGGAPVRADIQDPVDDLIQMISHEITEPALDIARAAVSDCVLRLETLRQGEGRTLVSTRIVVPLGALQDEQHVFLIPPEQEDGGVRWQIRIADGAAKASYRLDRPSRQARRWFRNRFHTACRGETCQSDERPRYLQISMRSATASERAALVDAFGAAIAQCRDQSD